MPPLIERRWVRGLGGYLFFLILLSVALTPVYLSVESSNRIIVIRLGTTLVLGVALVHLGRVARRRIHAQPPSAFERALDQPPVEFRLAPLFVRLRDEVRFSMASQQYFAGVLWIRLQSLLARRPRQGEGDLAMPPGRRWLRRGPSLATLRDVVAVIEEEP